MRRSHMWIGWMMVIALSMWAGLMHAYHPFPLQRQPAADEIRISQVYGGGGNSGAPYSHDFIEVFNGGASTVNLEGWSVQYASSSGSTWRVTPLETLVLQPGQYGLIQEMAGAGSGQPLPAADITGTISLSASSGKVALAVSTTPLSGDCPQAGVIDLVGYGIANCFEGSSGAPIASNTLAVLRNEMGCTDTDDNGADFESGAPTPRNRAAPLHPCNCPEPVAPTEITISLSLLPAAIEVRWQGSDNNMSYQVWRKQTPYFTPFPGVDVPEAELLQTTFVQTEVVGPPPQQYMYMVSARNACHDYAGLDAHHYVGLFEFPLTSGLSSQ